MSLDVYLYGERVGTSVPRGRQRLQTCLRPRPGRELRARESPAEQLAAGPSRALQRRGHQRLRRGIAAGGRAPRADGTRARHRRERRLPDAHRAGPGLPGRGELPAGRRDSPTARPRGARLARRGRTGGSGEAAPAALLQPRLQAADALRPARPSSQAQPHLRRGGRPLGLARGGRPEHARGQARDRRIPRIRRQRDVLHDRLPPGRHTGRQSDGEANRRSLLPGLAAL